MVSLIEQPRLDVVMRATELLMFVCIPEEGIVAAMRDDVIDSIGRDDKIPACVFDAQRMFSEVLLAVCAPSSPVPRFVRDDVIDSR